MERLQEEFRGLVNGYLSSLGREHESLEQPGCFIEAEGVLVQLLLEPGRAEVTFSATIFDGVEDPRYLVQEIISDFNAVNLFRGGYCLLVEEVSSGLRVNQRRSLASLSPRTLGEVLDDFAGSTTHWRRWYRMAAGSSWPSPLPEHQ